MRSAKVLTVSILINGQPLYTRSCFREEAYKRTLEYIYGYKIEKVIAKRDTKGNGVWETMK